MLESSYSADSGADFRLRFGLGAANPAGATQADLHVAADLVVRVDCRRAHGHRCHSRRCRSCRATRRCSRRFSMCCRKSRRRAFATYVEGGGTFVTSFRLGVKDESSQIVRTPLARTAPRCDGRDCERLRADLQRESRCAIFRSACRTRGHMRVVGGSPRSSVRVRSCWRRTRHRTRVTLRSR